MTNNKGYNYYKDNLVYTAKPEDLTLMLYNGAIKFIMQSQNSINKKEVEKSNYYNIRAQDIIIELMETLDRSYEISKSLYMLYEYIKRRLIEANIKKDVEILDEVLGLAKDLRNTWLKAMKIARKTSNKTMEKLEATV